MSLYLISIKYHCQSLTITDLLQTCFPTGTLWIGISRQTLNPSHFWPRSEMRKIATAFRLISSRMISIMSSTKRDTAGMSSTMLRRCSWEYIFRKFRLLYDGIRSLTCYVQYITSMSNDFLRVKRRNVKGNIRCPHHITSNDLFC